MAQQVPVCILVFPYFLLVFPKCRESFKLAAIMGMARDRSSNLYLPDQLGCVTYGGFSLFTRGRGTIDLKCTTAIAFINRLSPLQYNATQGEISNFRLWASDFPLHSEVEGVGGRRGLQTLGLTLFKTRSVHFVTLFETFKTRDLYILLVFCVFCLPCFSFPIQKMAS